MDVRLIHDPPAAGSHNMALDEALLDSAHAGRTTLRFYSWAPATLSLGYFQSYGERRWHQASRALDVVRRSTGGGAIVHHHELTYSFVTPISQRFSANHQQLVRLFHETLCESLAEWGIEASLYGDVREGVGVDRPAAAEPFLCFQRRAGDDVVLGRAADGGPKIAGTAQRRRRDSLLQHGSVLLHTSPHAPELAGVVQDTADAAAADSLAGLWSDRLAHRLEVRIVPGTPTQDELDAAEKYRKTRYEADDWLRRR